MKKHAALFLCGMLMFWGVLPAFAVETKAENIPFDSHLFEYFEYETIVLSKLSDQYDASVPNGRELYLKKAGKYEEFLKKYPNSPLLAEAKMRIAEFYKNVEKEAVYSFRVELYRCVAEHLDKNGGTLEEREECIANFYKNIGRWRDPVYTKKAADLLVEIVRDYGYIRRYVL